MDAGLSLSEVGWISMSFLFMSSVILAGVFNLPRMGYKDEGDVTVKRQIPKNVVSLPSQLSTSGGTSNSAAKFLEEQEHSLLKAAEALGFSYNDPKFTDRLSRNPVETTDQLAVDQPFSKLYSSLIRKLAQVIIAYADHDQPQDRKMRLNRAKELIEFCINEDSKHDEQHGLALDYEILADCFSALAEQKDDDRSKYIRKAKRNYRLAIIQWTRNLRSSGRQEARRLNQTKRKL